MLDRQSAPTVGRRSYIYASNERAHSYADGTRVVWYARTVGRAVGPARRLGVRRSTDEL